MGQNERGGQMVQRGLQERVQRLSWAVKGMLEEANALATEIVAFERDLERHAAERLAVSDAPEKVEIISLREAARRCDPPMDYRRLLAMLQADPHVAKAVLVPAATGLYSVRLKALKQWEKGKIVCHCGLPAPEAAHEPDGEPIPITGRRKGAAAG